MNNLKTSDLDFVPPKFESPCHIYPTVDGKQDIRDAIIDTVVFVRLVGQNGNADLVSILNQTNQVKCQIQQGRA